MMICMEKAQASLEYLLLLAAAVLVAAIIIVIMMGLIKNPTDSKESYQIKQNILTHAVN